MDEETDSITPPPVPPKTKSRARLLRYDKNDISNIHFPIDGSPYHSFVPTARSTTVNLNAVDCSIPADLRESATNNRQSTVAGTTRTASKNHVVKIQINPQETRLSSEHNEKIREFFDKKTLVTNKLISDSGVQRKCVENKLSDPYETVTNESGDNKGHFAEKLVDKKCVVDSGSVNIRSDNLIQSKSSDDNSYIRISVNNSDKEDNMLYTVGQSNSLYFYNHFNGIMSSGQISPSDTLDSGTCSDMDGTPPPLPKKKSTNGISVTVIGAHKKALSCTRELDNDSDNDSNNSSLSCDSLNCGKTKFGRSSSTSSQPSSFPPTLLQDIRQRSNSKDSAYPESIVDEKSYTERQEEYRNLESAKKAEEILINAENLNTDMYYKFHLNEKDIEEFIAPVKTVAEDESFAGYRDLLGDRAATIRSARGTVRGVKNRVRAGIATFLQINNNERNYKEKDGNKVVVYTTTMGIIRDTYQACMKVKQILRTLLIKFEERDVFMSSDYQTEIRDRMKCDQILVPQVYVDGQHIGVSLTEMAQNAVEFLAETDLNQDEINLVLDAIKKTFERSLEQAKDLDEDAVISKIIKESSISRETADIAARIIQQAYRRFKERKAQEDALLADWRVAAKSALKLYRKCGVSNEEAQRAATLIKAAYKGYYTRQMMKSLKQRLQTKQQPEPEPNRDSCLSHSENAETKFVTIDYDSVIPHVDFDTDHKYIEIAKGEYLGQSETHPEIALKAVDENPFESSDAARMLTDMIEGFESKERINELLETNLERQDSKSSTVVRHVMDAILQHVYDVLN